MLRASARPTPTDWETLERSGFCDMFIMSYYVLENPKVYNRLRKNKNALGAHTRRCKFNPKSPSYEPPKTDEPSPCPPAPIENVNL